MKMNKGLEISWTLNSQGLHVALNIEALCQQWFSIFESSICNEFQIQHQSRNDKHS
jgi:hypothetical protein